MLNREKFAKEIMDLALEHTALAITADGKICGCKDISCFDCKFYKAVICRTAFKRVNPNAKLFNYETFPDGKTSWTNERYTPEDWVCCELAREEDKRKYAKRVEY